MKTGTSEEEMEDNPRVGKYISCLLMAQNGIE